jgi:hypothetical protein
METSSAQGHCPLCRSECLEPLWVRERLYFSCRFCEGIFLDPQYHINAREERNRYLSHENSFVQKGYVDFLSRAVAPVESQITNESQVLDFGCGHTPVLKQILQQKFGQDLAVEIYDLYFFPKLEVFAKTYDFVFATEVVEHLKNVAEEWQRLFAVVKAGGILVVMTLLHVGGESGRQAFPQWWYAKDPTHIFFYSARTLQFLAQRFQCRIEHLSEQVCVFRKL